MVTKMLMESWQINKCVLRVKKVASPNSAKPALSSRGAPRTPCIVVAAGLPNTARRRSRQRPDAWLPGTAPSARYLAEPVYFAATFPEAWTKSPLSASSGPSQTAETSEKQMLEGMRMCELSSKHLRYALPCSSITHSPKPSL